MNTQAAAELGNEIAVLVEAHQLTKAYTRLAPVLNQRTHFPMLERIGASIGAGPLNNANAFLERVAAAKTEGGWVVIAKAIGEQLARDPAGAFARSRAFITAADVWYAADIFGERVPGPALLADFQPALKRLAPWRTDDNAWVRRTVGVAVHFWTKRSRGAPDLLPQAKTLLAFLEPMFDEQETDAIKGIGWGLKTLGKHYPDLVADWLRYQVVNRQRQPRALMLRKANTFLSPKQRVQVVF